MAADTVTSAWKSKVTAATTVEQLEDLYQEAVAGGFNNRARYTLVRQNQFIIGQVNKALKDTAARAFQPLPSLTQQGAGALFRQTVPGLIDQFGNLNAQIAKEYYQKQHLLAIETLRGRYTRGELNRAAARRATAILRGKAYQATVPILNTTSAAESIIGHGMRQFMEFGGSRAGVEVQNALTREVAAFNRDTILYNSGLDKSVVGVQRVAEPDACSFCMVVAFDQYGSVRVSGYAADYHNNCRCSIETLYEGDSPYKPDYYESEGFQSADIRTKADLEEEMRMREDFARKYPEKVGSRATA